MRFLFVGLGLLLTQLAAAQTTKPTAQTATAPQPGAPQPGAPQPGKAIYTQYCLTCHQANGSGVPGLNPPLRGTDWVTGDKERLINVLLKGLQNAEIDGEVYDNAMPAHDFLTDQQLADVLTYIRSNFGNKATPVTADEVKTVRNAK